MDFYKLEATGNDFIIILNDIHTPLNIAKLCNRHQGIGADGVILLDSYFNVKIYNSDGSEAKMCGNGMRCVCKLLNYLTEKEEFTVFLNGSKIELKQINEHTANVLMPQPVMLSYEKGYFVSLLNRHYITLVDHIESFQFNDELKKLSSTNKCNVHAVEIINHKKIKMKSYEYGVGFTKSCGSGSLASFFALYMLDKIDKMVDIIQEGGVVTCLCKNNQYYIQGNVNLLYKGELIYGI